MGAHQSLIVTQYAKMWPRAVFNIREGTKPLDSIRQLLSESGVYILYRDDQPYYVGQALSLFKRLRTHANRPRDKYYNFWNYFSAFVVPKQNHLTEVEGILIASMPTANSAKLRMKRIHLPSPVAQLIHSQGLIKSGS